MKEQRIEHIPRVLSIGQIQELYVNDIGYKRLKSFLLSYCPYKKVGNTYYFSRKHIENLLESDETVEYGLGKY